MKALGLNELCITKSSNRTKLIPDIDFYPKLHSALKRVANDTVPLHLVVSTQMGRKVLRRVAEFGYIRMPEEAKLPTDYVDIDEALLDAVALLIMASTETQRGKLYMALYYTEIENNNKRLMEAFLSIGSNQSPKENGRMFGA